MPEVAHARRRASTVRVRVRHTAAAASATGGTPKLAADDLRGAASSCGVPESVAVVGRLWGRNDPMSMGARYAPSNFSSSHYGKCC